MKKSVRTHSDTVDYKPTKRKKSVDGAVQYSERNPDWEEQKQLGRKFREVGRGNWPVAGILEERSTGKRKEYLVAWEPHPKTKEVWKPDWLPAANVSDPLIELWNQKNKSRETPANGRALRQSHGEAVNEATRPTRRTRSTTRGSPYNPRSLSSAKPRTRAASSSSLANGSRTPKPSLLSSRKTSITPKPTPPSPPPPSSTIEIAESEPDTSQPASVVVSLPPAPTDRSEYESLHTSQIRSDGGLRGFSSPEQPRIPYFNPSSQTDQGEPLPRRRAPVLPNSSEPSSGHDPGLITPSRPTTRISSARTRQATLSIEGGNRPTSPPSSAISADQSPRAALLAPNLQKPLTLGMSSLADSGESSRFKTPESVPGTEQQSNPGRDASEELGSVQRRRVLSIAELIGGSAPESQGSLPQGTFSQNTVSTSSPWQFETQAQVEGKPDRSQGSNRPKLLSEGFRSPARSSDARMAASGMPSPGALGFVPGTASPPASAVPAQAPVGGSSAGEVGVDTDVAGTVLFPSANRVDPSTDPVTVSPAGIQRNESRAVLSETSQAQAYDMPYPPALPIQTSIEEEPHYSNDEQSSSESKASSSQQSVDHERDIELVDGLLQPRRPILGPAEYAITLPAEGKVQSIYLDTINAKRKAILKFIQRHGSIGSSGGSPNRTHERNEMIELIQRLHDTTTHLDLGLPGFGTQYSIESEHHAAYAKYAGSKFSFLGHLVDILQHVECSIIIMAQAGAIQDLLEQYLTMKHISVRRQDRLAASKSPTPDRPSTEFRVHLVSTMSTHQVSFSPKPILMIAFDASFDAQDPQVMRIRSHFAPRPANLLPVIHLLISNSSEHVDLCLPKSMPSPARLKALVRATYQARPNLGGKPTYVPDVSDEPEGRPMDFSDLQRALRKSPERKLIMLASIVARVSLSPNFDANWSLGSVPELQLTEIEDTPPKVSAPSTVAETPKEPLLHSRTPISRGDTPSGRKRLLEVDGVLPPLIKRQRMTPLRDSAEASNTVNDASSQLGQLQELVNKLQADLVAEKEARQEAETERKLVQEQLNQWRKDHAALQRRYEKRMTKCHELENENKKLGRTIENNTSRQERVAEDNSNLKKKVAELREELTTVRNEIKAGGGDVAALEAAREEAQSLRAKNGQLEKSLENTRKDFEFTRYQYQEASNKAAEFAKEAKELEEQVAQLAKQAADEKRRLRETNFEDSVNRHLAKISELELERKSKDMLLRKLEEENRTLKRSRGIQTRGSSVQPPGSPGLDGHGARSQRSRPSSPAPGLFPSGGYHSGGSNRGSLLRHER